MANEQKKFAGLSALQTFLDKCKEIFAPLTHTHSYDDLRNKPFYEGTDYSSIFASTVNFYEWGGGVYGAAVVDAPQVFKQDISHKVIWDGVEYTLTSAYAGDNESGNPITSLGAPYGDYSTYPFGIDSYQTASGTFEYSIHTNSTNATHTIDILELGSSFVTIDDRFISNNIARTLDVDTAIDGLNNSKADKVHNHTISEVANLQTTLDTMNENLRKNTWYGTCSTAAATAEKVVTTASGDFKLETGNIVYVLFTYASCTNATLNVDGKGAKNIKIVGNNNVSTYHWSPNEVVGLVYDGTYFRVLDGGIASTTYYGVTKLSSSTSSTSTNAAATPSAVKAAYDLANSKQDPATTLAGYGITDAYSKADQTLTMIYDSGEITEAVNTIVADVDISSYKTIQVVVQNVNDGSNTVSTSGSAILTSQNGTTYQFPMFNSLFGNTSGRISGGYAHFKVIDNWVICQDAANINSLTRNIFSETDDGTVTKFSVHGGSGIARCTSPLSTLAVTSYNYNANAYFGVGSRIMVWGCRA